jgi:hypothetical protein
MMSRSFNAARTAALAGFILTVCAAALAAQSSRPAATERRWHGEIDRIVQTRCASCHRAGGVAPFALESRLDVEKRAGTIARVVEDGVMPPWFADKKTSHAFQNDRSLLPAEKQALLEWLAGGAPEGDPKNAIAAVAWPTGWTIGEPDAIVAAPQPYDVPAEGAVKYKYAYAKTDFAEDRWIQKMEIRCSQPQVVHHVLVFLEEPRSKDESKGKWRQRFQGGLYGYFAGLTPGEATSVYVEGRAKRLPAGATLKFQIHYTPNGKAVRDQTEIGFVFAKAPPQHEITTKSAMSTALRIPPGKADYEVKATHRAKKAGVIYSFAPHMHLRGAAFKYEILFPDGRRLAPLDIPRFDFNWQFRYELAEPIAIPEGTTVVATARFDNSDKNPLNPDPSQTVTFGEQTSDEMMIGYFEWEDAAAPKAKAEEAREGQ